MRSDRDRSRQVLTGDVVRNLSDADRMRLLELQLNLECVSIEDGNTLVPFACEAPDNPPRFLVVDTGSVVRVFYRQDLPVATQSAVETMSGAECLDDPGRIRSLLGQDGGMTRFRVGALLDPLDSSMWPDVMELLEPNDQGFTVFGIMNGDEMASGCSSVRENDACGEAYVYTEERFRGRGYAKQVVSAWADALQRAGKVPFYSYAASNVKSARVAKGVGVTPVFDAIAFE